jgi:hypothetical protein
MNPIERRLQKIEAVVMPKPAQAITVLVEPKDYASAENLAAYAVDLAAAKASGVRLVVVRESANRRCDQREQDDIEYVPTLFDAGMIVASVMPSERGNKSLLDDVMQDLSGRTLGPVKLPRV